MTPAIVRSEVEPVLAVKSASQQRGGQSRLLQQLEPGQLFSARVQARLENGSYQVELDGQPLRMSLPASVLPGDRLHLSYLTDKPRLTFALQKIESGVGPDAKLSATGRQLSALMNQGAYPTAAVTGATPLLAGPTPDGGQLAARLQQSLAQSGLFYEAHQAQWVAGTRSLEQLRLEPQAQMAAGPRPSIESPAAPSASAASDPGRAPGAAMGTAAGPLEPAEAAEAAEPALRPGSLPLLQQQLGALESGRVMLLLEAWPRQWMQWEVDQPSAEGRNEGPEQNGWRTRLRLQLPQLGELNATLLLGADGLDLRLDAADAETASLLQRHRSALQSSLLQAGVASAGIFISARAAEQT